MAACLMKPGLLFISPVFPSPDGPGLAMRPYCQIVSLSRLYSIHLLVAGTSPEKPRYDGDIGKYCDRIDYICRYGYSGWKFSLWHRGLRFMDKIKHLVKGDDLCFAVDLGDSSCLRHDTILTMIAGMEFERVHTFRLYLGPVAETLMKKGLKSFYSLDIDDIESETRKSISGLLAENGDSAQASGLSEEAKIFFNVEKQKIPNYDQIFICSRRDRDILQNRFPDKVITVLPNVIPITKGTRNRRTNSFFTMLFVGTMGYYPNTDAVMFFAEQIAPILREESPQPWRLHVVGSLPEKAWIKQFESVSEIEFPGWVNDLSLEYDAADIIIVPIRGGGGTRIKILEAFARGIPVVSTSKGAEGLDIENGAHLLIEDTPRLFAEACIRLMKDHQLGDELSRKAFSLVAAKYSPEIVNRVWTEQSPELD